MCALLIKILKHETLLTADTASADPLSAGNCDILDNHWLNTNHSYYIRGFGIRKVSLLLIILQWRRGWDLGHHSKISYDISKNNLRISFQPYIRRMLAIYQPYVSRILVVYQLYVSRGRAVCLTYVSRMSAVCPPNAEAARGIARAAMVGVATDPGLWGPAPCRTTSGRAATSLWLPRGGLGGPVRRPPPPTAGGLSTNCGAGQFLDSRMPQHASNYFKKWFWDFQFPASGKCL